MSGNWEPGWIAPSLRLRRRTLWRGVEAQHLVATLRLAETAADHKLLEDMLESSKPPLPPLPPLAASTRPLHYLLATPFRYRSPIASRFRRTQDAGAWYGAEELRTACAEVAYWRWRFLVDSDALAGEALLTTHSFFRAQVRGRCLDLTRPPWSALGARWRNPRDYSACHALAVEARGNGTQWIRYASARVDAGHCGVVFEPGCLAIARSAPMQTWVCHVTRAGARLQRSGTGGGGAASEGHEFSAANGRWVPPGAG